jgi:phosphatidylinositol glycan class N
VSRRYTHGLKEFLTDILQALGYIYREFFSVMFVGAAFWPAFYGTQFLKQNKSLAGTWIVACLAMSSFTLLPAMKVEDLTLM